MKRALMVVAVLAVAHMVFAGGIVTNTNQSAQFVRTLSRNASSAIDATYFNPAGLTQLADGFHVALYNQTIMQEKSVKNSMPLSQDEFIGKVDVPFFPNVYAVYKQDKWAVSFGFGPNGGGGTADFADGLPSFEMPIATLPGLVQGATQIPTSAYKADIAFKGSSVYYGFQVNGSYQLTDMLAVAVGARYISAVNTYEGAIQNIQINPTFPPLFDGSFVSAVSFFQALSQMNPEAAGYIPMVQDKQVDVKQTGSAITPIIGLNIRPIEKLNVGIKYELNTGLVLTNETTVDNTGMFPDGVETNADIPAILAVGAQYDFMPQLRASASVNYYFDKNANWDGREDLVDNNYLEIAAGAEFDLTEALLVSAGYLRAQTGVSEEYQTDISHSLSSNTVGFGVRYTVAKIWDLDLGALYTMYDESTKTTPAYTETYNRTNLGIAVGVGYHF